MIAELAEGERPTTSEQPRIAVVEDERPIRDLLLILLRDSGFEAEGAADGESGLELVRRWSPGLLLQNYLLTGVMSGLDVCREIRRHDETTRLPIVFYTACVSDSLEDSAYELGVDEYLRTPSFPWGRQLAPLVKAVLKRAQPDNRELIETGLLRLDPVRRDAQVSGEVLRLTPTEFDILHRLALAGGSPVSRAGLLDRGGSGEGGVDRRVDLHILFIRRKLGRFHWLISTVWGVGYALRSQLKHELR